MTNGSVAFWVVIALTSAAFGALYGVLFAEGPSLHGIIYGTVIGTIAIAYERGVFLSRYSRRLRGLPTLGYVAAAECSLGLVVVVAMAAIGLALWCAGVKNKPLLDAITPQWPPLLYSMAVAALLVSVLRVRDLIGSAAFANLILGRYHRPVSEERVFLFVDLVGSTAYAEKHGDLAAQELLKSVFAAIAEPVRRHRGQVDDYIGDQVIISWPLARGTEKARCIACVFAIRKAIAAERDFWIRRFGLVPELRAAIHGGSVVTAEVGVDRHKIAYFGDVMNATARLEGLCRETGHGVLISDAALSRMPNLPHGITTEALGHHRLRGRAGAMAIHALTEGHRLTVIGEAGRPLEIVGTHWATSIRTAIPGGRIAER
jgi:adenylate cyclase